MTIKEYWDKNKNSEWHRGIGRGERMLWFRFSDTFMCWIDKGMVMLEQDYPGDEETCAFISCYALEHIKTIDQYKELCKLLLGEELKI